LEKAINYLQNKCCYLTAADELVLLTLQESYSLPVLMYVIPALS